MLLDSGLVLWPVEVSSRIVDTRAVSRFRFSSPTGVEHLRNTSTDASETSVAVRTDPAQQLRKFVGCQRSAKVGTSSSQLARDVNLK